MGIKSLFKHLLLTTAVLSMYACGGGGESSNKTETIIEVQKQQSTNLVFADQKLADCVQALIDSEGYTLVEEIKQLTCSDKEIVDIEGIQNLSSLELLNLSNNQIRDITPISKLGKLKQLYLQGNNLQLLSSIAENQLLEQVDISDNGAIICSEKDQLVEALGDKLTKSEACIEQMQQAQDVTFEDSNLQACIRQTAQDIGAQYLKQIQQLKCVNHAINDIDGIEQLTNLRELDLTQNSISDITPLENLSLLKKVLLGKNQISNTQPLTTSKYMQELRLDYNQLTDIQYVQKLTALRQIHLTNNQIRDITPLQSLTELLELRISNNHIIDIDSLANLPKLSSLWIQGNQIADLTPLGNLQNLEQLWLSNNWLTDLTTLQTQSKLKWLHLDGTEAADLNPLNKLTQLKWLQLDNTRVDDITAIYPLAQLDWLHLKGNNTIPCSQLDQMEEILTAEKIDRPETCSQPQEQHGTVISTIEFQDQALKDCVYDAAREQGVASADELTTLSCTSTGITDITELTQFPGITNVDLTGNDHISCAQLEKLQQNIGEDAVTRPEQCNLPPTVAAQQEQTVTTGTQVDLNAEATDPNGDSLTYTWQQTAGQTVQLTNQNTATPNFTAPQGEDQTITLLLTVTDQYGLSTTQVINILVAKAFLVTNYEDLKKVGTGVDGWNLNSHYLQTADIDATLSKTENPIPDTEGEYYGFEPIGNYIDGQPLEETAFVGGYDGGGYIIDGLTINELDQDVVGLFGYAQNGTIENVSLTNVEIVGQYDVAGGLVGIIVNGLISNSHVAGNVTANTNSAGLVGININGSISNSYAEADVMANVDVAGGLVGINDSGTISNSYATGDVAAGNEVAGGLAGINYYSSAITNSYAGGNVSGSENVGGLVGGNSGVISSSYARGNVIGNSKVGGLVGHMAHSDGDDQNPAMYPNITNGYSTGLVQLQNEELEPIAFGGLVGFSDSELNTITNSFWDIETSGQYTSSGGTGLTTAQMQTQQTYTAAAWDFTDVWVMRDYPEFQWGSVSISSIEFIDTALRDCVYQAAAANGWTQSNQVTSLTCSGLGITDTSGLEQLTDINDLDLSENNQILCLQLDSIRSSYSGAELNLPQQCVTTQLAVTATASPNGSIAPVSRMVDQGTTTTFTITPDAGYQIATVTTAGCDGTLTDNSYTTGAVAADCIVNATFSRITHILNVINTGIGQGAVVSTSVGIDCGAVCEAEFDQGTTVALTATPADGSVFVGWSENCTVVSEQCQITLNQAYTVTASFDIQPPQNINLSAGESQIVVNWDEVAGTTGYAVYWSTNAGIDLTDDATYIGSQIQDNSPYTITGLDNEVEYFVVVTAKVGSTNESAASAEISATPKEYVVKFIPLNDTGITLCANEDANDLECSQEGFPNQDAEHGRDALAKAGQLTKIGGGAAGFDYTKICNSGEAAGDGNCPAEPILGAGDNEWACTRDNVTGFMWEVKTDDGGLRDKDNTYTWYNQDPKTNGGDAGTENGGECPDTGNCDTEKYVASVNAQGLCGYSDWRMPSIEELRSIVNYGFFAPAIDKVYFPKTKISGYWTSSPRADNNDDGWNVDFNGGGDNYDYQVINRYVRLVHLESN